MIRLLEKKDAEDYLYITLQTARETPYLSRLPDETNETLEEIQKVVDYYIHSTTDYVFVAEVEGKVVGMCQLHEVSRRLKSKHKVEIGIKILQDYTNLGLGSLLMNTAIEFARIKGYSMIILSVMKENSRAIHVYEKVGFKQYGELKQAFLLPDGTYQDEVYMVKYL